MATTAEIDAAAKAIDDYWSGRCGEYLAKQTLMDMARAALDAAAMWTEVEAPPTAGPIPEAGARRWRHKKRGSTYVEIGHAKLQTTPPNTLADYDEMVIYRSEADGSLWCRARSEFEDGRFECLAPQPPAPAEGVPDVSVTIERARQEIFEKEPHQ